ncbi:acyl-CoA synthetase (AMP-forming)/AMP-acid ligase II [Humitalea rosea]|uniref:Acyl-CoA synthetase (AMP-forming)/AMP-acid ligase II n=1 Tax=Humitalea rosea TaxID=990373 RepID=A0A2W7HYD6_9PROT|nr:acyl--CoA ligase [Humitalea rosea]PZW38949.1 acyl-CoA synthetase (AMP-forming)/AMP-acid ligase II [Humitalea rosea]
MNAYRTVAELLMRGAPTAAALRAPDQRPSLDYTGLRALLAQTVATLNGIGIGRGDRVAIVLPNGPEMATAFICVAAGATTAPLNPGYRTEEFAFYLEDLKASALIVAKGTETPARTAATALGVQILELVPGEAAGSFTLEGGTAGKAARPGLAEAEDVALVLHTSGTTARPKIVPLTQANITASAAHIERSLSLAADDCCLNVMPLFHIHGLIAAVLSSLAAGGAVCCSPGFDALRFFRWLDEERPSWYTAVPTMHQTILARAERNREVIARAPLRFLRSSSASMPAAVMRQLEEVFGAPLVESYGMTEAAHQMASNPLAGPRKPGLVGLPAGPEMAIMAEDGSLLAQGEIGEVVIRGPNVTAGYEANPEANAKAFTNGWFRTGDQGMFDPDGFLMLTGRLKELINRGGEKISPLEVDGILSDHPAVAQALTFAIPHSKLGEEVGCVVVLREGMVLTERELRDHAALHLADFKVPRKVVFLAEIPKGATGKLMRIGLAEKLGIAL